MVPLDKTIVALAPTVSAPSNLIINTASEFPNPSRVRVPVTEPAPGVE